MLKFKLDENMPLEAAELLMDAGHDAATIPGQGMGGASDPVLAAACQHERRAIVTLNLDFADIRLYPPAAYAGILVFRLARLDKPRILSALGRLIPVLDQEPLAGKLWIVDESRVRIRG
jgi:predicted nuclease of predicted toxin-antitoxin system